MNGSGTAFSFLWTPGRRRLTLPLHGKAETAANALRDQLAASEEVEGRVAGRGVKIERQPRLASQKGAFAPVFYGLLVDEGDNSRLSGHVQLRPVGRLFIGVWLLMSTLLALGLLGAAALRATPQSAAGDLLPLLPPVLLPFLGLAFASWQRKRGRSDEQVLRSWLEGMSRAGTNSSDERG